MEEMSYLIFKGLLPQEWCVHEYRPDYGIDLVVEIFKFIDETREAADTLGELFFVQLKSVKQAKVQKLTVKARTNAERATACLMTRHDGDRCRPICYRHRRVAHRSDGGADHRCRPRCRLSGRWSRVLRLLNDLVEKCCWLTR